MGEKDEESPYVDALLTRWADHTSGQPDRMPSLASDVD